MAFRKIARATFSISVFIREKMAPKAGTVAPKIDFSRFPGKRGIDPGFFWVTQQASLDKLERAKFRCAAPSRLACRLVTDKQTDTTTDFNGLLGRRRSRSLSLARLGGEVQQTRSMRIMAS